MITNILQRLIGPMIQGQSAAEQPEDGAAAAADFENIWSGEGDSPKVEPDAVSGAHLDGAAQVDVALSAAMIPAQADLSDIDLLPNPSPFGPQYSGQLTPILTNTFGNNPMVPDGIPPDGAMPILPQPSPQMDSPVQGGGNAGQWLGTAVPNTDQNALAPFGLQGGAAADIGRAQPSEQPSAQTLAKAKAPVSTLQTAVPQMAVQNAPRGFGDAAQLQDAQGHDAVAQAAHVKANARGNAQIALPAPDGTQIAPVPNRLDVTPKQTADINPAQPAPAQPAPFQAAPMTRAADAPMSDSVPPSPPQMAQTQAIVAPPQGAILPIVGRSAAGTLQAPLIEDAALAPDASDADAPRPMSVSAAPPVSVSAPSGFASAWLARLSGGDGGASNMFDLADEAALARSFGDGIGGGVGDGALPPLGTSATTGGALAATAAAAPSSAATAAQISAQMLPLAQAAQGGPVELILSPAELGQLRFEIHQRGEMVQIVLSAERADTADLLRRHGDQLLQDFKNAGFSGASLSFGQWGTGRQNAPPPDYDQPEDVALTQPTAPPPHVFAAARPHLDPQRSLNLRL